MKRRNLFKLFSAGVVTPLVGESKQEQIVNQFAGIDAKWQVSIGELENDLRCWTVDDRAFDRLWPTAQDCGLSERFTRRLLEELWLETARSQCVIANALVSIMTRLSRPTTISYINKLAEHSQLDSYNVDGRTPLLEIEDSITYKIQVVSTLVDNHNSLLDGKDKAKVKELSGGIFQAFVFDAWLKLHNEGKI